MKQEDKVNVELRRQLDERREARSDAVAKLKMAAQSASAGRKTPITDRLNARPAAEPDCPPSSAPDTQRIKMCRDRAIESREARSKSVAAFKETSFAVCQTVVGGTVRLNGATNGASPNGRSAPA